MAHYQSYALRRARKQAGWTQKTLASYLEVAPSTIQRWEKGTSEPYQYHKYKLCSIFQKSAQELGLAETSRREKAKDIHLCSEDKTKREYPSTYIVEDFSNMDELYRLSIQDTLATAQMGGVLSEQSDPGNFHQILDVACGTGGWLIEVAKMYPNISLLVGIDISSQMIEAAQERARAAQVSDRVQFHTMDALRTLDFPNAFFDLINQRFGLSFLRTWDWNKFLQECKRVLLPGGIIRLTEADPTSESTSAALLTLNELFENALFLAGHSFSQKGVTSKLEHLLKAAGYSEVQMLNRPVIFKTGTDQEKFFTENIIRLYKNIQPFLHKWVKLPADFDALYQQLCQEVQQQHFQMTGHLVTAWGRVPWRSS